MGDTIDRLAEHFARFPGIGPRQAKRFVFFLLTQPASFHRELAALIGKLQGLVAMCDRCARFFAADGGATRCSICSAPNRDSSQLLVVEKDSDLETIEKSGSYRGYYFVLGGKIPILEKEPRKRARLDKLTEVVELRKQSGLQEVILAFSVNPDGEHTADIVAAELAPLLGRSQTSTEARIKVSKLGRGLSTGLELEYSDPDTLESAFKNRS